MRRGGVVGALGGVVLALAAVAGAATSAPVFLTRSELKAQAKQNGELQTYLDRNGYPDVAEVRDRLDSGQWENETVILYYLGAHKQLGFAMAHMYVQDFGSHKFTREMTDEEVAALSSQPSMRTPADEALAPSERHDVAAVEATDTGGTPGAAVAASTNPADRAEAAAFRAEQAANMVEEAAVRTENAAARAEAVVEKMVAASSKH